MACHACRLQYLLPVAAVLLFAIATPPAAAATRPDVFGVGNANGGWTLLDPPGYDDAMWDTLAHVGATSTRIGASWPQIQPTSAPVYQWDELDAEVAHCLAHGITPYCLIVNTPAWASPTGEETSAYPPENQYAPQFQAFCTALAARYAGLINYWEFWNEENGYGWHDFNQADEYVPWLRRAYQALKAGNPDCLVALGGMDDPDIAIGDPTGYRGAYYLGLVYYYRDRWYPGETIFDAVADHPYCRQDVFQDLPAKLQAIRDVLGAHGDFAKPVWITEYGWSTDETGWTAARQAQYLHDYLTVLTDPAYDSVNQHVTAAQYLAITDFGTGREGFGLCDQNLRPKLAFYTFQGFPRGDAPQISRVTWKPAGHGAVQVSWTTHIAATSQVEYGPTAAYGDQTIADPTLVSLHSVLVEGLDPGAEYHFRVISTAPGVPESTSPDYTFRCADGTVPNAGFESGFGPGLGNWWTSWGRPACTDGVVFDPPRVHSGSHSQVCVIIGHWGTDYYDFGIESAVAAAPGRAYTFSAWTKLETGTAGDDKIERRVGTDPTGGTDPTAATVVWSAPSTTENTWQQMTVSATAQAPVVTVFIRAEVIQAVSDVYYWMYADDCDLTVEAAAPAGFLQPGWNLIGVPANPLAPDAATVLQDCVAAGNPLDDRLFRYWPGSYQLYPRDFTDLDRGAGYWLYLDHACACSTPARDLMRPEAVALSEGWSMIGSPQSVAVPLAACRVTDGASTLSLNDAVAAGWVNGALYYWEPPLGYRLATPAGYGNDDSLRPWRGYWIRANRPGLSLVVPAE
jgi:hypothetical protein